MAPHSLAITFWGRPLSRPILVAPKRTICFQVHQPKVCMRICVQFGCFGHLLNTSGQSSALKQTGHLAASERAYSAGVVVVASPFACTSHLLASASQSGEGREVYHCGLAASCCQVAAPWAFWTRRLETTSLTHGGGAATIARWLMVEFRSRSRVGGKTLQGLIPSLASGSWSASGR